MELCEGFAFRAMIGHGLERSFHGVHYRPGSGQTMRDGIKLVADISEPAGAGPYPVLLMRQPYGRDIASTVVYAHPTHFARQGYIVVIQDVRGRGDSEGEFYPFRNEIDDGYDTVAWAASLPKANGEVGMYGFSYQGSTCVVAAMAKPPALKAIAPHMTAFDLYSGWFYRNGILQLSTTLGWANQMLREDAKRSGAKGSYDALEASWRNTGAMSYAMPLTAVKPIANSDLPTYGKDWLGSEPYDGYWEALDLLKRADEFDLPMFHIAGWYDTYARGSMDGFKALQRRGNQLLVAGPWVHIPWGERTAVGDLGSAARIGTDDLLIKFFDAWLKGTGTPPTGVEYFSMGGNAWHSSSVWPPSDAKAVSYYLSSYGRANSRFGDGKLHPGEPSGPEDMFNYDPEVPVLAPGGNAGGGTAFGPADQSSAQQGNNLLVYTSEPLHNILKIVGQPCLTLWVASSAPETDFVAKLTKVLPDGKAIFLTLGAVRLTSGIAHNGATKLEIPLDDIAATFETGTRLRLDVASSAFPLLIRNPHTRPPPSH